MTHRIQQEEGATRPLWSDQRTADSQSASVGANPPPRAARLVLAAWLIPGLGHLLQRSWTKAAAFFMAVVALAGFGYALHGAVFLPRSGGPLDKLGFLADIGCGGSYGLLQALGLAGADLSHAAGDYGSCLIAAAGIVNLLAMVDVFEMVGRRKS
jgi:hypothetical protein